VLLKPLEFVHFCFLKTLFKETLMRTSPHNFFTRFSCTALCALSLSVATVLVTACGGGGSSANPPNVTGGVVQASAGSPIGNAKITFTSLSDSTTVSASADSVGNIGIPQTGLSYPAIVQATSLDGQLTYYGYIASSSQATAPVNPITSLILALASNGNPSAITSAAQLTDAAMATAKSNASAIFANILTAYNVPSGTDLLITNFAQNHTGLDLLLDTMSMQIDALGNSVLCSKINGACKTITASAPNTTAIAYSAQDATALAQAPLSKCFATISGFSLSSLTTDAALYSASFLNNGQAASQYMSSTATAYSGLSVSFNTPLYIGQDGNGNYLFKFSIVDSTSNKFITNTAMPFNLDAGGNCVLVGNQLPFAVTVSSLVLNQVRVDGTSNPSAVTNGAVTGLFFQAGGSSIVQAVYQGVAVKTLSFDYCDLNANCTPLVDMQKGATNNGFYFAGNPVPLLSYSSVGMTSANFYNGNANPIKVTFKDASGNAIGNPINLKVNGRFISDTELASITVPSITNATALLSTATDLVSPTINYATNSGFVVTSATLTHGAFTGQTAGTAQMILSRTSGSTVINDTINATTDTYRSLVLGSNIPGGGIMRTKYVWSPLCASCT
jgi:hypothetical protein